jgi:hypothetical protein
VSLFDIESQYGLPWRVLLITPLNDFVGPVRQTSSFLLWLIIAVIPFQIILVRKLSHRTSPCDYACRGITASDPRDED